MHQKCKTEGRAQPQGRGRPAGRSAPPTISWKQTQMWSTLQLHYFFLLEIAQGRARAGLSQEEACRAGHSPSRGGTEEGARRPIMPFLPR